MDNFLLAVVAVFVGLFTGLLPADFLQTLLGNVSGFFGYEAALPLFGIAFTRACFASGDDDDDEEDDDEDDDE